MGAHGRTWATAGVYRARMSVSPDAETKSHILNRTASRNSVPSRRLPRVHAHELATYLTSRATYLLCWVQTGSTRTGSHVTHTRFTHVQTGRRGGDKEKHGSWVMARIEHHVPHASLLGTTAGGSRVSRSSISHLV